MRKSTVIAIAIVVVGVASLSLLMGQYLSFAEPELRAAKEMTDAFRPDLLPGTRVRLRRVQGGERYAVKDPLKSGLIVEASAAPEALAKDRSAIGLARSLAEKAFTLYGPDRPVEWAELRIRRSEEDRQTFAFARGQDGTLEPLLLGGEPASR